ncbi:predicted protein [Uncinocarpus reesii 1704]|uniref:D-xylose reductase [NAD(P)H] n=1 Tax=Uncinocarpus reesii (strain UAMH 1704) TaxID=336963 RepID=C4JQI3_UNCRE|nr:uncharacterized protein UREG_03328 [Uncinocarpus reesii 1704]EEP78482.1 predicted protein [Uncinocarpus reesii 1704]
MSNDDTTRPQVGPKTPYLVYGTAWKEEKTGEFTETAFRHGFTGVDTANHPTAYNEPLTGDAIEAVLKSGVKRSDLFIQTKFTPLWAHDKSKIPFNPDQSLEGQIRQSIQQSFDHLKVDYLDAFMLHAPFQNENDNLVAWKVFETYVPDKIRCLGVSNFSLPQLKRIYENSTVKPLVVQNRFHRDTSAPELRGREISGREGTCILPFNTRPRRYPGA